MIRALPRVTVPLAASLFLAAAAVGCRRSPVDAASTPKAAPVPVHTVEATSRPMPHALALTGTLRGERQTELAANAMGRVLETAVERGTEVKKGDLLAKVDIRAAALSAAEARANAALAKSQSETATRDCSRYKLLLDRGTIAQAEYDRFADQCKNAPLSVAAADARATAAALVVGDGQIKAPFEGVVTERWVEVGQYVRHDTKVVSVVSLDPLRLELTVPEARLADVKQGGKVTFTVPAYPDRTFEGTLRFVGAAVRETTRDVVAEATVANADRALRPGMFASIGLALPEVDSVVVPESSVVRKGKNAYVFVLVQHGAGHRVEQRLVQLGAARDAVIAVTRGVAKGERVVDRPEPTLRNGQPATPDTPGAAGG